MHWQSRLALIPAAALLAVVVLTLAIFPSGAVGSASAALAGNSHREAAASASAPPRAWATNSMAVSQTSTEWFLAEGCTAPGFETWTLVQNPSASDANVHLTYMTPDGAVAGPSRLVRAGTRATFNAAETVGSVWEVSTLVTSDSPVVAERAVYGENRTWATNSMAAPQDSTQWFLAEGCTASGYETWTLVQNSGAQDANVSLTYMTPDGTVAGPSKLVKAGTRATFSAADTVGSVWEVSTRVTSDRPVVAERAMYGRDRTWATNSMAAPQTSTQWYLAEGCTQGFDTWILVQNPDTRDANVSLTYMTTEGTVTGPSRLVKAGTRATFSAADTVGSVWQVATRVTSDRPVVAERAMYAEDQAWATNSMATPEAATEWFLAEGCTAPGFETWTLVQNSGTRDATVSLTYMTPDGNIAGPSRLVKAGTRATFNAADTVGSVWEVSTRVASDNPVVAERSMYGQASTDREFFGLCYGDWVRTQPSYDSPPDAWTGSALALLSAHAEWITTYRVDWVDLEYAIKQAHKHSLKVAACPAVTWDPRDLKKSEQDNQAQLTRLIALINAGCVDSAVIGNEPEGQRGGWPVLPPSQWYPLDKMAADLVRYINRVRQETHGKVPVGIRIVESVSTDWHKTVVPSCDFVQINVHPANWAAASNKLWTIGEAVDAVKSRYALSKDNLAKWGHSKVELQIGETGWNTSDEPTRSGYVAGQFTVARASEYKQAILSWSRAAKVKLFYFEAFDEPAKAGYKLDARDATWGVWHWTAPDAAKPFVGTFVKKY